MHFIAFYKYNSISAEDASDIREALSKAQHTAQHTAQHNAQHTAQHTALHVRMGTIK